MPHELDPSGLSTVTKRITQLFRDLFPLRPNTFSEHLLAVENCRLALEKIPVRQAQPSDSFRLNFARRQRPFRRSTSRQHSTCQHSITRRTIAYRSSLSAMGNGFGSHLRRLHVYFSTDFKYPQPGDERLDWVAVGRLRRRLRHGLWFIGCVTGARLHNHHGPSRCVQCGIH